MTSGKITFPRQYQEVSLFFFTSTFSQCWKSMFSKPWRCKW